jgi:hypothetical protein
VSDTTANLPPSAGRDELPQAKCFNAAIFSWRLAYRMAREQPGIFFTSCLAYAIVPVMAIWAMNKVPNWFLAQPPFQGPIFILTPLLQAIIGLPIIYAALRRVLLQDKTDRSFWRSPVWTNAAFIALYIAMALMGILIGLLQNLLKLLPVLTAHPVMASVLELPLWIAWFYYSVRLSFLAPALMMKDPQRNLRTVWKNSRKQFWKLFLGRLCAIVPILPIGGVFLFFASAFTRHVVAAAFGHPILSFSYYLGGLIVSPLVTTPAVIANATVTAIFYHHQEMSRRTG